MTFSKFAFFAVIKS